MDDLDHRLVHAVQLSPRARWAALAPVLGVDAVTLARRWDRMTGEGIIYATAVDKRMDDCLFTFLQIECRPAQTNGVVDALVHDRAITTVDRTAGTRSLMATLVAEDAAAVGAWTRAAMPCLPGIRSLRPLLVTDLVADARAWRLRALQPAEVERVRATRTAPPGPPPRLTSAERDALIAALAPDFRAPVAELAAHLPISPRRIRHALAWLLANDHLAIRIDVARALTPWPIYVWYYLNAPASTLGRVLPILAKLPEMRVAAPVLGEYNIVFAAWLRTLTQVQQLETAIEHKLPDVTVADRAIVLHTEKHVGHLLNTEGFATGEIVPLTIARRPTTPTGQQQTNTSARP